MTAPASVSGSAASERHWGAYAIEAGGAATILSMACLSAMVLHHPASPVPQLIDIVWVRRLLMGVIMGSTVYALVHSRWGRRSGAHFNPAITFVFWRLGRISPTDAAGYIAAQFLGAALGFTAFAAVVARWASDPAIHFVTTRPGAAGVGAAFAAEVAISLTLMLTVLTALASRTYMKRAGLFAAVLVASFITIESPLSGSSMNPARSFGSALVAREWMTLWVYFAAPLSGMLLAAALHRRRRAPGMDECAKLRHDDDPRTCHFCAYRAERAATASSAVHAHDATRTRA